MRLPSRFVATSRCRRPSRSAAPTRWCEPPRPSWCRTLLPSATSGSPSRESHGWSVIWSTSSTSGSSTIRRGSALRWSRSGSAGSGISVEPTAPGSRRTSHSNRSRVCSIRCRCSTSGAASKSTSCRPTSVSAQRFIGSGQPRSSGSSTSPRRWSATSVPTVRQTSPGH